MMPEHAGMSALIFLCRSLLDAYLLVIALRFCLEKQQADPYSPLFQMSIRLTDPGVLPLQRFLPVFHHWDFAILCWWMLIALIKIMLLTLLQFSVLPVNFGLCWLLLAEGMQCFVDLFFYALIALSALSWFPNVRMQILWSELQMLLRPILLPLHRLLPSFGGIDLTPLFGLILLKVIEIGVIGPLFTYGMHVLLAQ